MAPCTYDGRRWRIALQLDINRLLHLRAEPRGPAELALAAESRGWHFPGSQAKTQSPTPLSVRVMRNECCQRLRTSSARQQSLELVKRQWTGNQFEAVRALPGFGAETCALTKDAPVLSYDGALFGR